MTHNNNVVFTHLLSVCKARVVIAQIAIEAGYLQDFFYLVRQLPTTAIANPKREQNNSFMRVVHDDPWCPALHERERGGMSLHPLGFAGRDEGHFTTAFYQCSCCLSRFETCQKWWCIMIRCTMNFLLWKHSVKPSRFIGTKLSLKKHLPTRSKQDLRYLRRILERRWCHFTCSLPPCIRNRLVIWNSRQQYQVDLSVP